MKVIILNGTALSGKDTFADFIIKHSDERAAKISTIDKVKEVCQDIFGTDPNKKTNKNRKLWCDFKSMWTEFNDGPFDQIVEFIKKSDKNIFCVFVREPTEIQKFKDYYGKDCLTVLIRRDGIEIPNNHGDQGVENYEYDRYIHNTSLKHLEFKAVELLNKIQGLEKGFLPPKELSEEEIESLRNDLKNSYKKFKEFDFYSDFGKWKYFIVLE